MAAVLTPVAPGLPTPVGKGLTFGGMTYQEKRGGCDLTYSIADKAAQLYLCIGSEDNRVLVSGTTPTTREAAVLNAIDQTGKWAQKAPFWMTAEKGGSVLARTAAVQVQTHVKPYYGKLKISEFTADSPALTYPGNGHGRLLSKPINDRYYFIYNGQVQTEAKLRGFDCTSFPMALLSVGSLPKPGYGKQLCEALQAQICGFEQMSKETVEDRLRWNKFPNGIYILFSAGHVLLYNSDINTLHEFNYGGYRKTVNGGREMSAPQGLWWMRKLDEKYRPFFN